MSDTKLDPKSRYYDAGGIETIDIIKAKLTPEQFEGYCLGNMIKYSCRMNHKGQFDRDNDKVNYYSGFLEDARKTRTCSENDNQEIMHISV